MSEITIEPPKAALLAVIERWHGFMRGEDPTALDELLHDDVVLHSPVVFRSPAGKPIVTKYLTAAKATFAAVGFDLPEGPTFRYVRHLASGDTAMLEFETEMAGKYVNGVDIIRVDDDGRIVEFRVLVRPLQAVNTVHQLMGARLAEME
jgi:ketosteroid isomerase-like protein